MVARGGSLNLIGALASGLLQFALVVVVTRSLTKGGAGAFFEALAVFVILTNTTELGADTGVTRMIPKYRVLQAQVDIPRVLAISVIPAAIASAVATVVLLYFAPEIAAALTNGHATGQSELQSDLRVLAVFLPVSVVYTIIVAATRGFGTMKPNAIVDRIGRPLVQMVFVSIVALLGGGSVAVTTAWAAPLLLAIAVCAVWLAKLVGLETFREGTPRAMRELGSEFWKFTAPRGVTGALQITTLWLGTLIVGALSSPADASVYTATTRYLVAGTALSLAIIQAIGPKLSELLTANAADRAEHVYQVTTAWQVMIVWPVYFVLAVFAPTLLGAFGVGFDAGSTALVITSLAMLVATAVGPVDIVLLMAGRSVWNLFNVAVATVLNLALGIVLVPKIGVTGAAIGLAASLIYNNLAPAFQVRRFMRIHPFGRGFLTIAPVSALCFGFAGLATRLMIGSSSAVVVAFVLVATCCYGCAVWMLRDRLELHVVFWREK